MRMNKQSIVGNGKQGEGMDMESWNGKMVVYSKVIGLMIRG